MSLLTIQDILPRKLYDAVQVITEAYGTMPTSIVCELVVKHLTGGTINTDRVGRFDMISTGGVRVEVKGGTPAKVSVTRTGREMYVYATYARNAAKKRCDLFVFVGIDWDQRVEFWAVPASKIMELVPKKSGSCFLPIRHARVKSRKRQKCKWDQYSVPAGRLRELLDGMTPLSIDSWDVVAAGPDLFSSLT